MSTLSEVIRVDPERCVNCHACIAACPVKFCNDASQDYVRVNPDLCIGCGSCIDACTHDARTGIDDFPLFLQAVKAKKPMVAISAPAIAANFPDQYLRLHGWLESLGVEAFFDVSFGAELTVKSYLEHIRKAKPKMVIAQPCPAIVSYIEIYQPELLPYLAPADSPMLHTIKMIREYYPRYQDHPILILSPCLAKRREFDATGYGDFNVTYQSLQRHIEEQGIDLKSYPEKEFSGRPAERAVLFSSPGGLQRTVARESGAVAGKTRKIEGPHIIYNYLKQLPEMVEKGFVPPLVDCLNCETGCNGGPGTMNRDKSPDEIESYIEKRKEEMRARYRKKMLFPSEKRARNLVNRALKRYWREGLYGRSYTNRSGDCPTRIPDNAQLEEIYHRLRKYEKADFLNCGACGYGSCKMMAIAIHNGLNSPVNCFHYERKSRLEMTKMLFEGIRESTFRLSRALESLSGNGEKGDEESSVSIREMVSIFGQIRESIERGLGFLNTTIETMGRIRSSNETTSSKMRELSDQVQSIWEIVGMISSIADQTKIIAFNAELEASSAGETGQNFEIVAAEIRRLADSTVTSTAEIKNRIRQIQGSAGELAKSSGKESEMIREGADITGELETVFSRLGSFSADADGKIKASTENQITIFRQTLEELSELTRQLDQYEQG